MDNYEKVSISNNQNVKDSHRKEIWKFLNICSVLLALISFFTTSQGLKKFFFQDNELFAYIGSAAIQGLLMGMNLRFAKYIEKRSTGAKIGAAILYALTLLCSSSFSYVYVSNSIYENTRLLDSNTELSSVYEKEKESLKTLTNKALSGASERLFADIKPYTEEDSNQIGDRVSSKLDIEMDWDTYEDLFEEDPIVISAIKKLRNIGGKEGVSGLNEVQEILAECKNVLESEKTSVSEQIKEIDAEIDKKRKDKQSWIDQRYTYKYGTAGHEDSAAEIGKIDSEILDLETEKDSLKSEISKITEKENAINNCVSYMQIYNSDTTISIKNHFTDILLQITATNPDMTKINEELETIFSKISESNDESYDGLVENYRIVRDHITAMANICSVQEWLRNDDTLISDAESCIREDADDTKEDKWRDIWLQGFSELKENIRKLPLEMVVESDENGLKELRVLEKEREDKIYTINKLQREHLSDINEVEKAKLYLFGKYTTLAWFSLVFAVYLDTAPLWLNIFKYFEKKKPEKLKNLEGSLKGHM